MNLLNQSGFLRVRGDEPVHVSFSFTLDATPASRDALWRLLQDIAQRKRTALIDQLPPAGESFAREYIGRVLAQAQRISAFPCGKIAMAKY